MIRKILTIAVPLLAPIIAYIVYIYYTNKNRHDREEGRAIPHWRQWPWVVLVPCGALLTALSLLALGLPEGNPDPGAYVPPRLEDGKVVPGGFGD